MLQSPHHPCGPYAVAVFVVAAAAREACKGQCCIVFIEGQLSFQWVWLDLLSPPALTSAVLLMLSGHSPTLGTLCKFKVSR